MNVEHHDFFSGPLNGEKFDVGYDYTFFCAIHPSMRGDWGRAWAEHIKSGGKLVALCYPDNPSKKDGPPWHVSDCTAERLRNYRDGAASSAVPLLCRHLCVCHLADTRMPRCSNSQL